MTRHDRYVLYLLILTLALALIQRRINGLTLVPLGLIIIGKLI